MEIALIGLGKMGANMAQRLISGGHRVFVYDLNPESVQSTIEKGGIAVDTLENIKSYLMPPRAVWVMVPAGLPTETTLETLSTILEPGDIIIDGGNSYYKDSIRRASQLNDKGLHFIDIGTSGGIWGLQEGYSLMIGGAPEIVHHLQPIFETLAPAVDQGWGRVGPNGAGHFVKMIHNGIEYGLMQAYAEGFELMSRKEEFNLDLAQIAEIWKYGSVVRSWLLDLASRTLQDNPSLEGIAPYVSDSGEGRWTVLESVELGCAIPVITLALQRRFLSRDDSPFSDRLLAALRNQFGGHEVKHI
jgi:6-phosphogluconate dehydrogenase